MRIKKLSAFILLLFCGVFFFAACKQTRSIESISLNGYSAQTPLEISVGKFPYEEYTLVITYDNGETEQIPLTEDMVSKNDQLKFFQEGTNEITISYQGVSTPIAINVSRKVFPDSVQLNDFTATYTGEEFIVEVEGDIPGGTQILYPQGNTFENAGTYDITAVLLCDGYVSKTLSACVVIEKATYDVSNAQLYSQSFVYDQEAHAISVKGKPIENTTAHQAATLPNGVSVSYTITKTKTGDGTAISVDKQQSITSNQATDAGTYLVCAHYKGDAVNYQAIQPATAYLVIERADYNLSDIQFFNASYVYTNEEYRLSIANPDDLPYDVEVSYQIKREKTADGQPATDTFKQGNGAVDAGKYCVKATFTITGKNANNYLPIPADMQAYLTIERASYDEQLQALYLDSQWYDKSSENEYKIWLSGELLEGITPVYTVKDATGAVVQGSMDAQYVYTFITEQAGEYTCEVSFTHENNNFAPIQTTLSSWVIISDGGSDA